MCLFCFRKGALVYEQLGYKAFGIPGKLAASCSITMQNIGGETSEWFCLFFFHPFVILENKIVFALFSRYRVKELNKFKKQIQ